MEGAKNTGEVASNADLAAIAEGCARECEKKGLLEVAFFAWQEAFSAYDKLGQAEKAKECLERVENLRGLIFAPFASDGELHSSFLRFLDSQIARKSGKENKDAWHEMPERTLFRERLKSTLLKGEKKHRVRGLIERFGLTPVETELLLLLYHMEVNESYDKKVKQLYQEEYLYYPSVTALRRFLSDPYDVNPEIFLSLHESSRVVKMRLVETIRKDPTTTVCKLTLPTLLYLTGATERDCVAVAGLNLVEYKGLAATRLSTLVLSALEQLGDRGRLGLFGPKPFAIADLSNSEIPCLIVDCASVEDVLRTISLARLVGSIPVLAINAYFREKCTITEETSDGNATFAIEEILAPISEADYPCVVVASHELQNECIRAIESLWVIEYPKPDQSQVEAFVRYCLKRNGYPDVKNEVVRGIASAYINNLEGLEEAVRHWTSVSKGKHDLEAANRVARSYTARHFLGIAEQLRANVGWEDLVLPQDILVTMNEIISFARYRDKVMHEYGFAEKMPYGHALTVLFSGPPGTGKTLAACVIANELGVDCYRVDLSRVVSKWVGETEKNLAKIFDIATHTRALLLFDEADSLFGLRTEVKTAVDRYANLEVNYLLQRLEEFDGVCILTTNRPEAIDPAFKRRLRFKVSFPFPDVNMRSQLWRVLIPKKVPVDGKIKYDQLAADFELSGAQIRNAILRATFMAASEERALSHQDLMEAARKEAKEAGILVRG